MRVEHKHWYPFENGEKFCKHDFFYPIKVYNPVVYEGSRRCRKCERVERWMEESRYKSLMRKKENEEAR